MLDRLPPRRLATSPRAALLALLPLLLLLAACGDSDGGAAPAPDPEDAAHSADGGEAGGADAASPEDAAPDAPETATCEAALLETQPWTSGDLSGTRELWRLPNPDGGCAYAIWYPPVRAFTGGNPAVLITDPYNGIDWTGDPVDARWSAAAGAGGTAFMADVDSPGGSAASESIPYSRASPAQTLDLAFVYLVNGLGVMIGYGRFYAGGDLLNDVGDVQAALAHMATRPGVDPARLGTWGGSWGAFESLYSGLGDVKPRAIAALAPPVDFPAFDRWAMEGVDDALTGERRDFLLTFYAPYLRRIRAALERSDAFDTDSVCARLSSELLLIHDTWDLLVPVDQSRQLAAACPQADLLLNEHTAPLNYAAEPIDHGPIGREAGYPSQLSFSLTYLLTRLLPADQPVYTGYDPANLRAWLQRARDAQPLGADGASTARRLLELCDARVLAFDLVNGGEPRPGCEVAAEHVNATWGGELTPEALRARLEGSSLPEP
jgi:hypothetical protein